MQKTIDDIYNNLYRHYYNLRNNVIEYFSDKTEFNFKMYDRNIYKKQWIAKCKETIDGTVELVKIRKGCEVYKNVIIERINTYNDNLITQRMVKFNRLVWSVNLIMFIVLISVVFN